jgi:hypothetical protein
MLKVQSRFHEYYRDALCGLGFFKEDRVADGFITLYLAMRKLEDMQHDIQANIDVIKTHVSTIENAQRQGYLRQFTAYQQSRIQEFVTFFDPYIYPNGRPKKERGFPWAIAVGIITLTVLGGVLWILN